MTQRALSLRTDLHLARKLWHCLMGLMIATLYAQGFDQHRGVMLLGIAFVLTWGIEVIRLSNPAFNQRCIKVLGPIMRQSEVNQLSGTPYYIAAAILVVAILPREVAVLSLLYLAFGDPASSLVGVLWGRPTLSDNKSWAGVIAGILACMAVTAIYGGVLAPPASAEWVALVILGGLIGGTAEFFLPGVDDNLSIPVVSGGALWVACLVLGL